MPETEIDIKYVAELARLELNDSDAAKLQRELGQIVNYIAELGELDVSGVEPTAHASLLTNVVREDVRKPSFDRSEMLKNAPGVVDDNLVKVPQVLPGEGMN